MLAQALWSGKLDRRRVVAEARRPRSAGVRTGPRFTLAEVDAWLAAHPL